MRVLQVTKYNSFITVGFQTLNTSELPADLRDIPFLNRNPPQSTCRTSNHEKTTQSDRRSKINLHSFVKSKNRKWKEKKSKLNGKKNNSSTTEAGDSRSRRRSRNQKLTTATFESASHQIALTWGTKTEHTARIRTPLLLIGIYLQIVQLHAEVLLHHAIHSHCWLGELGQFTGRVVFLDDGGCCQRCLSTSTLQPWVLQLK